MTLKTWYEKQLAGDLRMAEELLDERKEEFIEWVKEFWNTKFIEDREIVLEDLLKNEGHLYIKMVLWNESKIVKELDLNMLWYEYSLEDYFRDEFGEEFGWDNVNEMVYGEDYEDMK